MYETCQLDPDVCVNCQITICAEIYCRIITDGFPVNNVISYKKRLMQIVNCGIQDSLKMSIIFNPDSQKKKKIFPYHLNKV